MGTNVPGYGKQQLLLDLNKRRESAHDEAGGNQHDEDPEVELDAGPLVSMCLDQPSLVDGRAVGCCGRHGSGLRPCVSRRAAVLERLQTRRGWAEHALLFHPSGEGGGLRA